MPTLYAISDLHLAHRDNRDYLARLFVDEDAWLIVAGDVGETPAHLELAWQLLTRRFARVLWVPGNHELWRLPRDGNSPAGEARYRHLVEICHGHGVLTPEDPYPLWEGPGGPCVIALLFVLYDYSFRPAELQERDAVAWAMEEGILCTDEVLLEAAPFTSIPDWCRARVRLTLPRLEQAAAEHPLILVNHFPLRADLVRIPAIPRFSIWCGTTMTEDWHRRFRAKVVVSGHLHVRSTDWRDGVRFEEVSLGSPEQRDPRLPPRAYLREILPGKPR